MKIYHLEGKTLTIKTQTALNKVIAKNKNHTFYLLKEASEIEEIKPKKIKITSPYNIVIVPPLA